MSAAPRLRISNIVYIKKPVKDFQKPIRFTLTMWWTDDDGLDHGGDVCGCLAGVGRDGQPSWSGPLYWIGKKVAFSFHPAPGTYKTVLSALQGKGYFDHDLTAILPKPQPAVPASVENGLEDTFDV
tara:strand:+ start:46 stop:423 length:378 start_codon:yes stop_codon:yes gene_type:complete